ncbi:hypothetical protein LXA43DRAFT_13492 [Ganoderma leucocontextum]|nr:hypothetical protein LXA43DRAFT_13492 [Ganoderma leucocontextum]
MTYTFLYVVFATLFAFASAQNKPPPVVVPKSGDVWNVGERQTVKWSTDGFSVYDPSLNPLPGIIYIGHLTESAQQIWFNAPLARNFTLADAHVDVIVPALPTAKNYFLVLFGSSDNWSQFFTIDNPADPRGTGTFGTTITVTPAPPTTSTNSTNSTSQSGSGSSSSSFGTLPGVSASTTAPPTSTEAGSSSSSSASSSASVSPTATVLTSTGTSTPSPTGGAGNGARGNGAGTLYMCVIIALAML